MAAASSSVTWRGLSYLLCVAGKRTRKSKRFFWWGWWQGDKEISYSESFETIQRIVIIIMNLPDSNKASWAQNIALVTAWLCAARNGNLAAFAWIIEWFTTRERNNWAHSIVWERTDWMFHCLRGTIEHETIWKKNNYASHCFGEEQFNIPFLGRRTFKDRLSPI